MRDKKEGIAAIEELHRRFAAIIHAKCFSMLGDWQEAEDALQETFLRAHFKLKKFMSLEPKRRMPYLYGIANNVCLHVLRARRYRKHDEFDEANVRQANTPEIQERTVAMRKTLEIVVDQLDERGQAIFVGHCIDGLTQGEIATSLGISRRAVVHRLTDLRAKMSDYFQEGGRP